MNRFPRVFILILCLAVVLSTLLGVKQKKTTPNNSKKTTVKVTPAPPEKIVPPADILAEYDGGMITKEDLANRISKFPAQYQSRFKTVEGQNQILDAMVVEDIFYRKSLDMNIASDPVVLEKIAAAKKQMLVQEYYKRNFTNKVELTEAEKQAYYNTHKKDYAVAPIYTINYLQTADEATGKKALAELKKGVPFASVSTKYSVSTYGKSVQGKIKNIRLNGYIPGVGNDSGLDSLIAANPVDTLKFIGPQQTSTGWSIIQVVDLVPGSQKTYLDAETEIDQRLRPQKENELMDAWIEKAKKEYKVVVDTTVLNQVNLRDPKTNSALVDEKIVTGSDPSLNMTVEQLLAIFQKLPQQEQIMSMKGPGPLQTVNQQLAQNLMVLAAAKDKTYDEFLAKNDEFQQSKRYVILQETYKRIVADQVKVTPEDIRNYYDTHQDLFKTLSARKLQVVWTKDEKTAAKARKFFDQAVKKHNLKKINDVIVKYNTKPLQDTLDNVYQNGIVPSVGKDQALNDLAWTTPVGSVSPVTKTIKGDILFFRVLEQRPETVRSFTEVEPRLEGQVKKDAEKTQMDSVKAELSRQYHLKQYPEKLDIKLSAEELFNMADDSARQRNYKDAVTYYNQIIQFYPNKTDDYKATFMKAFLITEEMGDKEQGLTLFQDFLKKYPTGELNESAQYMIDELQGNNPQIEEITPDGNQE